MNIFAVTVEKFKKKLMTAISATVFLGVISHYFNAQYGWEHGFLAGLLKFATVCSGLIAVLFFVILMVIFRFQKKASMLFDQFNVKPDSKSTTTPHEYEGEVIKKTIETPVE